MFAQFDLEGTVPGMRLLHGGWISIVHGEFLASGEFIDGKSVAICLERYGRQHDRLGRVVFFDGTHRTNESNVEGTTPYGHKSIFGLGRFDADCSFLERIVLAEFLVDLIDDCSVWFHNMVLSLVYPVRSGCHYWLLSSTDATNRVLESGDSSGLCFNSRYARVSF